MANVLRILDANANRAREALRVMEEAARFLLNDESLSRACKQLRHDLAAVMRQLPGVELHRDTPGDVGTRITTGSENVRGSAADVVIAAGKRLAEALRTIEEYSKTLPPPEVPPQVPPEFFPAIFPAISPAVEAMRYRGYEIERQLHAKLGSSARRRFGVCLLLTESLCRLPWREVLAQAIDAGCDCVQVREKTMESGTLLARAKEVVALCRRRGVTVIVNDRPDVALCADADGVHVGQTDLPVDAVRKLVGRRLLIGVSTSDLEEAERAAAMGADYCGVGPMFPTTTKHKDSIVGPAYLAAYLQWSKTSGIPGIAIGGITSANIGELTGMAGISPACGVAGIPGVGVAVSACVCGSPTPGLVVGALRRGLNQR